MTRSRYGFFESEYPYFMTSTIIGLAPVFTRPETFELIYDSWRFLQSERGFQLFAYVGKVRPRGLDAPYALRLVHRT